MKQSMGMITAERKQKATPMRQKSFSTHSENDVLVSLARFCEAGNCII